jgi:hypothetical protein
VVSVAALDVRRRPEHRSELGSQLLMGEVVRLLGASRDGLWWRVENEADRYRGWARSWGLITASAARAARWRGRATARIVRPFVEAMTTPRGGALVSPLFLNSRLIPAGARAGLRRLELPDGTRAWVPARSVAAGRGPRMSLVARVRSLLGVPYIWGGRTALGFDCSGFTQQVLAEQGLALPRDAWQQFRSARSLPMGDSTQMGDLIFFAAPGERPSHVAIALGGGYYAHARGRVTVGSIDPNNTLCDNHLLDQMVAVKRPAGSHPGGRRRREWSAPVT